MTYSTIVKELGIKGYLEGNPLMKYQMKTTLQKAAFLI